MIAFDTTYKNNIYNKCGVILFRFNHQGETTNFGRALVSYEKLRCTSGFKYFLEEMYHKHHMEVVTYGDLATREAIRDVFLNSLHYLCYWNLHQNAYENVKNPKFLKDFMSLICATYIIDEFENEWKRGVDDYNLPNNKS